jgi:hypothetical protein
MAHIEPYQQYYPSTRDPDGPDCAYCEDGYALPGKCYCAECEDRIYGDLEDDTQKKIVCPACRNDVFCCRVDLRAWADSPNESGLQNWEAAGTPNNKKHTTLECAKCGFVVYPVSTRKETK